MVKVRKFQETKSSFNAEDTLLFKLGALFVKACVAIPFVVGLGKCSGIM